MYIKSETEEKIHIHNRHVEKDGVKVIDCQACKYWHLWPIPSKEKLEEFYKNYYEESTPSPNFYDKQDIMIRETKQTKGKKRILDIGCWDGSFLKLFSDTEWEKHGVEPNKEKSAEAEKLGINVYSKVIEEIDFDQLGKFDAVNLSFVLEHLINPKELLTLICTKLLEIGGIICVEVPNEFNPLQETIVKNLGLKPWWIAYPDHINYFNFNTLKSLLTEIGFEVFLEETSFPMELFVLMGENYINNSEIGKKVHNKRLEFEENLYNAGKNDLKRNLYQLLPQLNIGRSVIMYARKLS